MRISFSLMNLAMGGAQNLFVQLANELAARGHILKYWLSSSLDDHYHVDPNLKTSLDQVANQVKYQWELWTSEIIHIDGYHSIRRKLLYFPRWNQCLETFHSSYSVNRSGPIYTPNRVAVSKTVQMILPKPCSVIYQGVIVPSEYSRSQKNYDVVILGRIHPVKNHLLFLEICKRLLNKRGHLTALIIGDHLKPSSYQEHIDNMIDNVRYLGVKLTITGLLTEKELIHYLSQARIMIVTSKSEGFGRMAIEAMSVGIPVVSNPVGGLLEIIQEGQTGFFAKMNDIDSFTEIIDKILDDSDLQKSIGNRARIFVKAHFSLNKMVYEYEKLYREIISKS